MEKGEKEDSNGSVKRSVSITKIQDRWLRQQKISLSKVVQEAINIYMQRRGGL